MNKKIKYILGKSALTIILAVGWAVPSQASTLDGVPIDQLDEYWNNKMPEKNKKDYTSFEVFEKAVEAGYKLFDQIKIENNSTKKEIKVTLPALLDKKFSIDLGYIKEVREAQINKAETIVIPYDLKNPNNSLFGILVTDNRTAFPIQSRTYLLENNQLKAMTFDQYHDYYQSPKQQEISKKTPFVDIENHWAQTNILNAVEARIISGYPDETFRPNNNITRTEFIKILNDVLFVPPANETSPFVDDQGWAELHIHGAIKAGIIRLEEYPNKKFEPNKPITRKEIARAIVRGLNIQPSTQSSSFRDLNHLSKEFIPYILSAHEEKLINGYQDQTFKGDKPSTRAEATTMLLNVLAKKRGSTHEQN